MDVSKIINLSPHLAAQKVPISINSRQSSDRLFATPIRAATG